MSPPGATPRPVSQGLVLACPAADQRSRGLSVTSPGWPEGHPGQAGAASRMRTSVTLSRWCMCSVVHQLPGHFSPCLESTPVSQPLSIYSAVRLATRPTFPLGSSLPFSASSCIVPQTQLCWSPPGGTEVSCLVPGPLALAPGCRRARRAGVRAAPTPSLPTDSAGDCAN